MASDQLALATPGQLVSQSLGSASRSGDPHGSPSRRSHLRLRIIHADGLRVTGFLNRFKHRRFYVTATDGVTTETTRAIKSEKHLARWDETFDSLMTDPSSRLTLRLFAARDKHGDALLGELDLPYPELVRGLAPHDFHLAPINRSPKQSHQVTLRLAITIDHSKPHSGPTLSSSDSEPSSVPREADDGPARSPLSTSSAARTVPGSPSFAEMLDRVSLPAIDEAAGQLTSASAPVASMANYAEQSSSALDQAGGVCDMWDTILTRMRWVVDCTEKIAEIHPYAKIAWSILSLIPKTILSQVERDENVKALVLAMHDALDLARDASAFESSIQDSAQRDILMAMLTHTCDCGNFIQTYAKDTQFWKRLWKNTGRGVDTRIQGYCSKLVALRDGFLRHAAVTIEKTTFQIRDVVSGVSVQVDRMSSRLDGISGQLESVLSGVADAGINSLIREIPYASGAFYRSDKGCLEGTRTAFLDYITDWVNDPESTRALVLFGQVGTGKSSIAHEAAHRFRELHRLASSFMFLRGEQSSQESHLLFTGLARDLSDRYPAFRSSLGKIIQHDTPIRRGTKDLSTIFKSLLLQPLKDTALVGPVFVVIDALDEALGVTGRNGLHTFLADHIRILPPNFRIFITSRPEHDIARAFHDSESINVKWMDDPELSSASEDIHVYLKRNLPADLYHKHGEDFARRAEGLFQWAAAACRYIQEPPSGLTEDDLVPRLLEPAPGHHPLDSLYTTILESYFNLDDLRVQRRYQSVMGQLFSAFEPLSSLSLSDLRRYSHPDDADLDSSVSAIVRNLGSLLSNVAPADSGRPITPLHTSFRDFLASKERAGKFWIDVAASHRQMAYCCLGLVVHEVHFNICHLVSSYQKNTDIPDIRSLIAQYISRALSYATRFWDDHLQHASFHPGLVEKLQALLLTKFPFWLESLSLLGCIDLALQALSTLEVWLAVERSDPAAEVRTLLAFVDDATAFVRYFAMPMSQSAPHIYLSALPFSPASSLVLQRYGDMFPNTIALKRGWLVRWPVQETVIGVGAMCLSVAFSPDGTCVASGLADGTIHMFSSSTGQEIRGPFTGHKGRVRSVVFSPDGRQLVSGSDDHTIRVWDTATGQTVSEPFVGHTGRVNSVALSPDGRHVASGSRDRTIRVWVVATGQMVMGLFTGHAGPVMSVAFSPNGLTIVSGSDDKTIRVWSAATGKSVVGPLEGHTNIVRSVAFSRDGQYIVSGSDDLTIRIWDVTTGGSVAPPLRGHSNIVASVAISQDRQRLVSCSADSTIRVWNAATGSPVGESLTGHGSAVRSIALSPDGRHVVSGSEDKTVRIWDMFAVRPADPAIRGSVERDLNVSLSQDSQGIITGSGPLGGHTDTVWSVTFSPDGRLVASCSEDRTIRIWDAATGQAVREPLTGHTGQANSVTFSPDSRRVASGSSDRTIRVWDVTTGQVVVGPLEGHQGLVTSVAFSPDDKQIASGSADKTIRIWDAATGKAVGNPFTGHTDRIWSITFSPNGQFIASGSDDHTIRVWDATTGQAVVGPFTGHTSWVLSVTFSPDGRFIASASYDHSIRIWDAATGQATADPFEEVIHFPLSVSFSPDGRHIVSGWDDGAIHTLDARTGRAVSDPFIGHAGRVASVAYSPDGQHIVSGSFDTSVRLWATLAIDASATGVPSSDDSRASPHSGATPVPIKFRTDQGFVVDDDGWIRGSDGELLVWIPEPHRVGLPRPNNVWVRAKNETVLDSSHFVHGSDWTTCFENDSQRVAL